MHALDLGIGDGCHLDDDILERLAACGTRERIAGRGDLVVVAVMQLEALAVFTDRPAEPGRVDTMHRAGCRVRPDGLAAAFDEDHPFGRARDDLPQLVAIGGGRQTALFHRGPRIARGAESIKTTTCGGIPYESNAPARLVHLHRDDVARGIQTRIPEQAGIDGSVPLRCPINIRDRAHLPAA